VFWALIGSTNGRAFAEAQNTNAAVALSRLIHAEFGSTSAAQADENQVVLLRTWQCLPGIERGKDQRPYRR
jgi:hypothetical protein